MFAGLILPVAPHEAALTLALSGQEQELLRHMIRTIGEIGRVAGSEVYPGRASPVAARYLNWLQLLAFRFCCLQRYIRFQPKERSCLIPPPSRWWQGLEARRVLVLSAAARRWRTGEWLSARSRGFPWAR